MREMEIQQKMVSNRKAMEQRIEKELAMKQQNEVVVSELEKREQELIAKL